MPATLTGTSIAYKIVFLSFLFTVFTSCYKEHLYVQQEWFDRSSLASSKVGTPDPRQENPPEEQRLIVAWRFSENLFCQELRLRLTVRFWDNHEELIFYPVHRARSNATFKFGKQKILTYRVDVINACEEILETWEHQFWTELIDIDRKSNSVSSQPRQGSVMETP